MSDQLPSRHKVAGVLDGDCQCGYRRRRGFFRLKVRASFRCDFGVLYPLPFGIGPPIASSRTTISSTPKRSGACLTGYSPGFLGCPSAAKPRPTFVVFHRLRQAVSWIG